mmetsp:Transcript_112608/g.363659  ORF Transcript_112608/g.363659 Transcript_112608/m.363659 type:complete len:109 (+) Transcript_112608:101-427(+)
MSTPKSGLPSIDVDVFGLLRAQDCEGCDVSSGTDNDEQIAMRKLGRLSASCYTDAHEQAFQCCSFHAGTYWVRLLAVLSVGAGPLLQMPLLWEVFHGGIYLMRLMAVL